jgi:hypothetical protein
MRPLAHRAPSLLCLVALFTLATALAGCSGRPSNEQSKEAFYKANPEIAAHKQQIGKFSGHVTVDGQPPSEGTTLFIALNNAEHPEPNPKLLAPCDADGHFEFKTYEKGDGVPVGTYIVEFVGLKKQMVKGRARVVRFVGPDTLNNLYNDPEKNKDNPTFKVDVTQPGRTDYEFELKVAGQQPVASPGKLAITKVAGM